MGRTGFGSSPSRRLGCYLAGPHVAGTERIGSLPACSSGEEYADYHDDGAWFGDWSGQRLDHGADDYIVKPFAIEERWHGYAPYYVELVLRAKTTLPSKRPIKYRDLVIEKENRVVRRGDDIIELTKREYELLLTLMENVNVVLARDVLLSKVWGYNSDVETNVVDVYVRYIRNKIDRPGNLVIFRRSGTG